jgi:FkbM family methyltransferase
MLKVKNIFYKIKKNFNKLLLLFESKYANYSFSQEGEDLILSRIFDNKANGFYVDVGAHHPKRFSNTYIFYKLGWRGINIEPNPEAYKLFMKYRSGDTNINCGVAQNFGNLNYYMFDESALNTFDSKVLHSRIKNTSYKHIKTVALDVLPLSEIFQLSLPKGRKIDFLTVDTEGFDLEVLKSNDWDTYRPKWVLVEELNLKNIENINFEVHKYMKSVGYILFAKTFNTLFYRDKAVSL